LYSRFPDKSGHMWERLRGDNEKDRLSALDELLVHDELAGSYRVEYEEGDARNSACTNIKMVPTSARLRW
jgi:hypothetical protein